MTESRQVENEPARAAEVDPDRLKREAQALRKSLGPPLRSRQYSALQKTLAFVLTLLAVGGSIYLLIDGESRRRLVVSLNDEWSRLYLSDQDRGVFKLPPPPPRQVQPRVVFPSGPVALGDDGGMTGTIYNAGEGPGDKVEKTFVPPPRTAQAAAAFRLLKAESEVASKLVDGQAPGLQFKEWRSVRNQPPVFFIDVLAMRESDQKELHFVWSVDLQQNQVEPLSQAARDLESGQSG